MKKLSISTLLVLAIIGLFSVAPVSAQTTQSSSNAVCPVGYTCTPLICPAGYICTPVVTQSSLVNCPTGYVCNSVASVNNTPVSNQSGGYCYQFYTNLGMDVDTTVPRDSYITKANIVALQTLLISEGFDIPSISSGKKSKGDFDNETRLAVMKYQTSKGIPATGFVGPLTRSSLNLSTSCNNNLPNKTLVSAYLYSVNEDKVGPWSIFNSGTGNLNKNSNDWSWIMNLVIPSGENKLIKRITISHNTRGEVWSTGYSRYLQDGTDLYGYNEHPYPLVVVQNGVQINKAYDQSLQQKPLFAGTYQYKLYGQPESVTFNGGKLIVEFNDGTLSSAIIPASNLTQSAVTKYSTPSPTPSPLNSVTVSVTSPVSTDSQFKINWSSYGGDFDYYQIVLGNTIANVEVAIDENYPISKYQNSYNSFAVWYFVNKITSMSGRSAESIKDAYYVKVNAIKTDSAGGRVVNTGKSGVFSVTSTSSYSPSPSPTQSPTQPSVSLVYPRGGETWYVGETKTVTWNYNNFSSGAFGNKYVKLLLVPTDGRAPVELASNYVAPYGTIPLKIYLKTSDGRDAWLPGKYKIKVVCDSNNVAGFKTCSDEIAGYVTVVDPNPTPSPTSTVQPATSLNNNQDIQASIWSAVKEYYKSQETR